MGRKLTRYMLSPCPGIQRGWTARQVRYSLVSAEVMRETDFLSLESSSR